MYHRFWHLRNSPSSSCSFSQLTLRRIIRIPFINRQIEPSLTRRLLDTIPPLNSHQPLPPSIPNALIFSSLPFSRNSQSPLLELVEYPQPYRPRRQHEIRKPNLPSEEERAIGVHFLSPFFQMVQKFPSDGINTTGTSTCTLATLKLEKPVKRRDNPRTNIVDPDTRSSPLIRIPRQEVRFMIRIGLFEILKRNGRFVEGLGSGRTVISIVNWTGEGWNQASRVQ